MLRSHLEVHKDVKYLTFSRSHRDTAVDIRYVDFKNASKTAIVVHGFSSKDLQEPFRIKDALFESDSSVGQVVVVSWLTYSTMSGKRF